MEPDQLPLEEVVGGARAQRTRTRSRSPKSERPVAENDPVAAVLVDISLAHLDRPFEYLVPAALDTEAQPGVRVRVRFAGRLQDAYVIERRASAEHEGKLARLEKVVSAEQVLTAKVLQAARQVADYYGSPVADALRLAIPPRHARAEMHPTVVEPHPTVVEPVETTPADDPWRAYPAGPAFLRRLAAGEAPGASWLALPAQPPERDWPAAIAAAVAAARSSGRGAVVVLPDHRDVDRVLAALEGPCDRDDVVRLTADLGPEARYRAFLRVLRGHARVVVGTRAAAWAPVQEVGLFVCWDPGDDLHIEQRAPYSHADEVLRIRASCEDAALLFGGFGEAVLQAKWINEGMLARVAAVRAVVRDAAPRMTVAGEGYQLDRDPAAQSARIPQVAFRALQRGLERGPVLVQVPRTGYVVSASCQECRTVLRCHRCQGPVGVSDSGAAPACRWCGSQLAKSAACPSCGSDKRRATGVGQRRTAEELGRAFPGKRVISSGGESVVSEVPNEPALVVATPGAEPVAVSGYRAVVLLDGWQMLERASLDAGMEAFRRWTAAAALLSPGCGGVLGGVPPHATLRPVEALIRWDPAWLAESELQERTELGLPPVQRHLLITGLADEVTEVAQQLADSGQHPLGPVYGSAAQRARMLVRAGTADLAAAARAVRSARSARGIGQKEQPLRLVLDPGEL